MRIEFEDIAENKRAYGCAQAPPGVTLGQIFDHDANLKKIEKTLSDADWLIRRYLESVRGLMP